MVGCARGASSWTTAPSAATTSRDVMEKRIMRREDRSILYALNQFDLRYYNVLKNNKTLLMNPKS